MLNGYFVLGMSVLGAILVGLLLTAYFVGMSRTKRLGEAVQSLRERVDGLQAELLSARTQILGLTSSIDGRAGKSELTQRSHFPSPGDDGRLKEEIQQLRFELDEIRSAVGNPTHCEKSPSTEKGAPRAADLFSAPSSDGGEFRGGKERTNSIQAKPPLASPRAVPVWQTRLAELLEGVRNSRNEPVE